MWKLPAVAVILAGLAAPASAEDAIGALWTPSVLAKVRDKTTLAPAVEVRTDHLEVFYDSESGDANWGDSGPPYAVHTGGTIRIHSYLAAPAAANWLSSSPRSATSCCRSTDRAPACRPADRKTPNRRGSPSSHRPTTATFITMRTPACGR